MNARKRDPKTPKSIDRVKRGINRAYLAVRSILLPRRPRLPLFILAEPRTGSTLIGDYLSSVAGVSIANEILSPTLPCGVPAYGISKSAALAHVARSLNALPEAIVGAKFLLTHLTLHELTLDDLRAHFPAARFLIVYRASLVEQFVSFRVAKMTNKWVGRGSNERFDSKIRLDPEEFLVFCRREHEKYSAILKHSWLSSCGRIVCYEEFAANPQQVFDETIFPFLGLSSTPVTTTMVKQIDRSMCDVIENFDEVEGLLAEHGRQRFSFADTSLGAGDLVPQSEGPIRIDCKTALPGIVR